MIPESRSARERVPGGVTRPDVHGHTDEMRRTWPLAVPLPVLGVSAVLVAGPDRPGALVAVVVVVTGAVALAILHRHPGHRIGWLLALHSCLVAVVSPLPAPVAERAPALVQALQGSWVLMLICPVTIAYLFPDGRAQSARWRRWIVVNLTAYVVFLVAAASDRAGFVEAFPGREPPLPVVGRPWADIAGVASLVVVVAGLVAAVVAARQRYDRSVGEERQRMQWFVLTALTLPAMLVTLWVARLAGLDGDAVVYPVLTVGLSALPVGIGVAVLRHGLFDVEVVLSRALTYAVLTVAVVLTYWLLLLATERAFGNETVGGLLAVGVVAVVVHPAYARVKQHVERRVHGYRSEPHEAIRMLADRAELADPRRFTESITSTVASALKVDRVWVEPAQPPATSDGAVVRVPLVHRGLALGDLALEVPAGRTLGVADVRLFTDLARYAAALVAADRLTAELQLSRSRLVTAQEEERRRLRRDLHDGLGPALAAVVLTLDAARTLPTAAERDALLAQTRDEARQAVAEVRRLVDDLRPAAIDQVGLLGALRHRATSMSGSLVVDVVGPEPLPPLPAAVEVAAYRIASEAVTNVVRHSGASRCRVAVVLTETFELTISDNGRGAAPDCPRGIGWTSMHERAAELGGTCTVSGATEGGLLVRAVLPLVQALDGDRSGVAG